jgi:hypothetical protein
MLIDASTIGVLICICAAIPVCILTLLTYRAHRCGRRLRAAVLGLTLIHELVLVAYPGWYEAATGFKAEVDLGITPFSLLVVYLGEALFVILFSATLYIRDYGTSRSAGPPEASEAGKHLKRDRLFLTTIIIAAFALYVGQFFHPTLDYEGLASNYQFKNYGGLSGVLSDWGGTLVRWPGLFAAGFVLVNRSIRKSLRLLAASVLIAEMVYSMINGTRGGVIWVTSVVGLAGYFKNSKKLLITASVVAIAFAPLLSWMHTNMRYVTLAAPTGTLNWQMIPALVEGAIHHQVLDSSAVGSNFMESWAIRAQGPLNSTYLYRFHDEGEGASYNPILGSITFPVPRALWSGKPVAGSTDASNLGSAIYRVQQPKPDNSFYDMGPILASAHAYWEGGWAFLYLAAVLTGWFWSKLLAWAEEAGSDSVNIIVLVFIAALPIDGFFSALNPIFTYIRLLWITLIPMQLFIAALDARIRRGKSVSTRLVGEPCKC